MTREEKRLLLTDLCARLPYKVICNASVRSNNTDTPPMSSDYCLTHALLNYAWIDRYKLRPYLRPMSSMTDEERIFYNNANLDGEFGYNPYFKTPAIDIIDWLNAHHFDYRGLIEKGLALEAPEDMYAN